MMKTTTVESCNQKSKLSGIVLLDKPVGLTSNAALQKVKRLYGVKKAGHTGSLDPLANGMLPICLCDATKFSQFLLQSDKRYVVVAKMGVKTKTGDSEGEAVKTCSVDNVSKEDISRVLCNFRGEITQIPSMYSALKHKGQPLYKLARQGIEIEREARPVTIYQMNLLDVKSDQFTLDVKCSKGTYIRTLVDDIGDALGVGAHVIYLRRTNVGSYIEDQMVTLDALEEAASEDKLIEHVLPIETSLQFLEEVVVSSSAFFYLKQGQSIVMPSKQPDLYRIYLDDGHFVGVGEVLEEGKMTPKRMLRNV